VTSPASAPAPAMRLDGVSVRYPNGALGITNVTFEVDAGSVVALFGPNGAGKTTSIRAASGFLRTEGAKVVSGTVTLFGTDVTNAEPHRTNALGLAMVAERRKVFPNMSVAENLAALGHLPPRAERAAAYERVYSLFPVLAERGRQLAGRLSGGEQQMLAIGRALLCNPRILVVDEMTLGLHHSLHEPLFEAVRSVAATNTSVVIVDESTGFALEVAEYCYLLGGGTVRDQGPVSKFAGSELLMAGYVESEGR
jgi:branched-chain amino acid transport system ATP-binding protein